MERWIIKISSVIPWEVREDIMGLSKKQRELLIGLVMGDGFLQKTGKVNARLRLEHSIKQKDYIFWKYETLKNLMQSKPKLIKRFNPIWKKTYSYYRCQSHSSSYLGRLRRLFYKDNRKIIPENIAVLLKSPYSLAIWYMDDGYLYQRDKSAYIYLSKYTEQEVLCLKEALEKDFKLSAKIKTKKEKYPCFYFDTKQTKKLVKIIQPYIIPSLRHKLLLTP